VPADTAGLAARAAGGDVQARDQLVAELRPMVSALARRFAGSASRADLEQSGVVGVLTAVEGFDPSRRTAFEAYASPFVIGEMARCARESSAGPRVPRSVRDEQRELERAIEEFTAGHGRMPAVPELAAVSGLEVEQVVELLQVRTVSSPLEIDAVAEHQLGADDPDLEEVVARLDLGSRLARLDARQRRILALRVGLGLSQREIADRVGMSQMHVSRLLRAAFDELASGV
jgi:RNA polymerase sigma-B factor